MILQTTLTLAACAALLNIWLMMRIGRLRMKDKILHGDGGHPLLMRRMRAQLNFVESAPFVLILCGAIELSGHGGHWLTITGAIYMAGRISHAFGMDSDTPSPFRAIGVLVTLMTLLGLSGIAIMIALGAL